MKLSFSITTLVEISETQMSDFLKELKTVQDKFLWKFRGKDIETNCTCLEITVNELSPAAAEAFIQLMYRYNVNILPT